MALDVDPSRPDHPASPVPDALAQAEAELEAVAGALDRLDDATYGRCTTCGAELDDDRLAAEPTATACAAHA